MRLYRVTLPVLVGLLLTACATTPPPAEPPAEVCVGGKILTNGLNMREGPTTQSKIIVTLPRGTPVTLAGCSLAESQNGRWVEIIIGPRGEEITGWISSNPRFVELREP